MSYIQAYVQDGSTTDFTPMDPAVTGDLDSEALSFAARLISLVDDLDPDDVIVIRKVVW